MTDPIDEFARRPARRRHAADEPVVDAALEVVRRAEAALAAQPTAPLLDEPSAPYRLRPLDGTGLALHPIAVSAMRFGTAVPAADAHRVLDAHAEIGGNTIEVTDTVSGRQEEVVGSWLATRRRRERTVLLARVGLPGEHPGSSAAALTAAVDRLRGPAAHRADRRAHPRPARPCDEPRGDARRARGADRVGPRRSRRGRGRTAPPG